VAQFCARRGHLVIGPRRYGPLLGCILVLAGGPVLAQSAGDRVGLILTQLPPPNSADYQAIGKRAGKAIGQVLPLTKSEMWWVSRESVEAIRSAAHEHGAEVALLASDWNHLFRTPPPEMRLTQQQTALMERAHASKGTISIGVVAATAPPMIEYALTKDASGTSADNRSTIVLALDGHRSLTITRTSVEIRPEMCVWRGAVDGGDAPATLMWWPSGKMTGMVPHAGRIYSIRHIGGEMHLIVETGEALLPQEHAPAPERPRAKEPTTLDRPER